MTETVTCCERNGFADKAEQCKCGRLCPEGRVDLSAILTRRVSAEDMTRRQQEAEARHQTERAIAADPVGVEAALPIQYAEPEPAPRLSGEAKVLIVAVCLFWLAILALSIADPRDLSTLWPRLVALASF